MKAFGLLFLIFCLLTMESKAQLPTYRMVEWATANDMSSNKEATFLKSIEFNNAQVYKYQQTFIILPLNPFSKAILTKDSVLMESWIQREIFPIDGTLNRFYFNNREKMDHLNTFAPALKKELLQAAGIESATVTAAEIDQIYAFLADKKNFEKYKLNYIAVMGDYLKSKATSDVKWGLLKSKQLLNPLVQMALVKEDAGLVYYFDLEEKLNDWEHRDRKIVEYYFHDDHWRRSNEIETAVPIE
jgi:phage pi2 protein 07